MLTLQNPLLDILASPFRSDVDPQSGAAWRWTNYSPAADVRATSASYVIELDVPGMSDKEIEVTLEDRHLSLKGERKAVEGDGYTRQERPSGAFERVFHLPEDADVGRIEARAKNGVLTVEIPKRESARPKTIAVKAE
jgi:HSP20 family protein